ncbi:MAG: nuoG, partial [Bacteroidetes bacterium]|nr:nuoG [Bacteroidota bacterium]
CVHCSVGCNTIVSERYDSFRRIMSRYSGAVNGYFICDRGRFGYEFLNDGKRIRKIKIRDGKKSIQEEVENEKLLQLFESVFSGNKKIIGIGSPRASLESNYALSVLVGKENFYHGIPKKEQHLTKTVKDFLQNSGVQSPSLKQIEKADTVIILGEDLTNTAPMIALAIRQSIRNKPNEEADKKGIPLWNDAPVRELSQDSKSPVHIATPSKDSLDEIAKTIFRASYEDIANLGFKIASIINDKAPVPRKINKEIQKIAGEIADSLKNAKNPLIISGLTCLFKRCRQIIVLDNHVNPTSLQADILLPAATFAESQGTLVNNEGRAQRFYRALVNKDQVKESWRWIGEFINIRNNNQSISWNRFDDIVSSLVNELPVFSKIKKYIPDADFRMLNAKIPRQTMRYSGRTAMNAQLVVSEPKVSQDPDSPLAFSMEGRQENPPSSLVPFYWTPGWNSVQAMYNYLDEPNGSMRGGDPGIRLIESGEGRYNTYFEINHQAPEYQKDELLVIPVYLIFGSDELSSAASAISKRIPEPFLSLNLKDAEKSGIRNGDLIQIKIAETKIKIKVKTGNDLPQGIAGLCF